MKKTLTILVADDDATHREVLRTLLEEWGYAVREAVDGEHAVALCREQPFDLVLMDVRMPKKSGLEALKEIKVHNPAVPVLIMTAFSEVAAAVEAIKSGAYDYLTKPLDFEKLKVVLRNVFAHVGLIRENATLSRSLAATEAQTGMVGRSESMRALWEMVRTIAPTDATVLITGESGTGKELVARAIHMQSPRQQKAFVAINCGAIPESLTESILFGYEGGAFSGAHSAGQTGLLEKANGGTLFLDEAGEMPPSLQAKMLRTLQNYKIRRVGGSQVCQLDVRIVAASNRNLRDAVKSGRFREDLFYRLDVIPLIVPPLRERQGDIRLLVEFFLESYSAARGVRYEISSGLLKKFEAYAWPGNVRELKNFVEYGICFSEDGRLTKKLLEPRFALVGASECPGARVVRRRKPAFDATQLETLLRRYGRSTEGKKAAARQMGISLATLYRHLRWDQEDGAR